MDRRVFAARRRGLAKSTIEADFQSASPAQAGVQPFEQTSARSAQNSLAAFWIPAFAGNTADRYRYSLT